MFIDIHCHLDLLKDIDKVVDRARKNNIKIIVYNTINLETIKHAFDLSEKHKEIKLAAGIYPTDCLKLKDKEINKVIGFIKENKKKIIAIGEVGIDLLESSDFEAQKNIFIKFIKLAKELDLPIIVHSRKAEEKVIEILENQKAERVIMHCFNGNFKLVDKIVKNNWFLSIPTNITFSEHFQKLVEKVSINNLFCETDSPFLHPVKGERNNEPANVVESYKEIAEIKKISLKEAEKQIEDNYKKLFISPDL